MLKRIRDSEQGIGDFKIQNHRNAKFVGLKSQDDHEEARDGDSLSGP